MITDNDVYDSKAWVTYQALKQVIGAHPCQHGHINCSYREGGTCENEIFNNIFQSLTDKENANVQPSMASV